jgi:hypothetical protein
MSRSFFEKKHATNASATVPVGSSLYRALTAPRTLTILVLIGVILRFWAYLADTALYLDEILLSYSILDLQLADLLSRPLPLDQVAPLDFCSSNAAPSQFSATTNSRSDSFLLCAIVSLILFRRLAERVLTGVGPTVALFVFAIGFPFIRYAVVVKQYELDVMAAILLMLIAFNLRERRTTTKRLLLLVSSDSRSLVFRKPPSS